MPKLPEIIPGDPRDPEDMKYKKKPLRYGLIGKIIIAIDAVRNRRDFPRLHREGCAASTT